ncbi:MAG: NAD(P)H-quinone oxidoreductase [Gammaproteobacteria bacterium]|nr:NAD(P)H-quinone oxidoreductase [Gammaproteobacteria bacterium]
MQAIRIVSPGGPEQLQPVTVPDPVPGHDEVLVRIHYAGINRADLLQRRGLYPAPPGTDSSIPGMEYSGVIAACGAGVSGWHVGDRVMGLVPGTAYAELVCVPATELLQVPDNIDLRGAAAIPEAFMTAWDAAWLQGGLRDGEWLLVRAATSSVGIAACQLALALGNPHIAMSRSAERLAALAPALSPTARMLEGDPELVTNILQLTGQEGVATILDLVGAPAFDDYLRCLRIGGSLLLVGVLGGAPKSFDAGTLMRRRLRLVGTVMRTRRPDERAALAARFRRDVLPMFGAGSIAPLVAAEYPLAEASHAHALIEANQQLGKVVLRCSP